MNQVLWVLRLATLWLVCYAWKLDLLQVIAAGCVSGLYGGSIPETWQRS